MCRRTVFRLLMLVAAALAVNSNSARAAEHPPNIIFILADDLGYGDLGCYGQQNIRTPRLDRMAAEGMRFTQFYAGSTVCAPSRCVLMTGLHTGHARIRGNNGPSLRESDATVAEALKKAGYATGLCGKWGVGEPGTAGIATRKGFDSFYGYLNNQHAHNYYPTWLWRNEEKVKLANVIPNEGKQGDGVASERKQYSADLIADEAEKFIAAHRDRPFFLYFAPTLPHANNEARQKGLETPDLGEYAARDWPDNRKAYAAMVSRLDGYVGRVLDQLKKLGLVENTIVFFSSDNGPHREGGNDPTFHRSSGPLRGIKRDLYDGGIRVPFIAWAPGRIKPGVNEHVGYFGDFFPTAVELAGAKPPEKLDGLSMKPTLLGEAGQRTHDYLYWEFYEGRGGRAVRLGNWKGVRPGWNATIELYDVAKDIGETKNVAADHPDIVARVEAIMREAHTPAAEWKVPTGEPGAKKQAKKQPAKSSQP